MDYVNSSSSSYLALSATGGDTLIGSDIPSWAPTIAPSKNWRVVKNGIAVPIQEAIGATLGRKQVPQMFREIHDARSCSKKALESQAVLVGGWRTPLLGSFGTNTHPEIGRHAVDQRPTANYDANIMSVKDVAAFENMGIISTSEFTPWFDRS
ncbi:uncharacterized protein Z519_06567 [Cladophialophora bantiana CBS 173.52]|uniref:Uncharacterized protein n=1 Tax=Cladophialophora bantiana (strain ATCC 10958 / CBS 173.52 / CDC B-1940 / NIH 8579) TaxID=1442370 RepID=A0A0D2I7A0_CLAB1|nr:uncharacterized protein Z519_06567 [Cladophialophora bantiana CBS 173.52]KIW92719.1 hypothetical protein Z519_06567 [Cladophialophora bantiana CBS 173.52]